MELDNSQFVQGASMSVGVKDGKGYLRFVLVDGSAAVIELGTDGLEELAKCAIAASLHLKKQQEGKH